MDHNLSSKDFDNAHFTEREEKKKIEALVDAEQKGEALLVTLWLLCLLSWRVL